MMLGVSGLMGDGATAVAGGGETGHDSGGGSSEVGGPSSINPGSGGGVMEEIERSGGGGGGNRWPRQETLALLKIRSEMDGVFRDASLKGPLWEDVSRKMAELGFQRSAKKCKEKFENVYKYHKRTKDGRSSKPDGKSYRFFDQLAALENTPPNPFTPPPPPPPRPQPPATTTTAGPPNVTNLHIPSNITVSSISPTPLTILPPNPNTAPKTPNIPINSSSSPFQQSQPPLILQPPPPLPNTTTTTSIPPPQNHHNFQPSRPHVPTSLISNSTSSSSSTSSDEDIVQRRRGRKRKWKDYFERLMKDVIQKQEELQNKFIDALEKRERDRTAREEAWRAQEIARMNREHEVLVQERSIAAAKDTAVIAFLQKVTDQHNLQIPISNNNNNNNNPPQQVQQPPENPQPVRQQQQQPQPPPPPPPPAAEPPPQPLAMTVTPPKILEITKTDNGGDNFNQPSSSRWPKTEVEALIKLRTSLDLKYQDNGPKGPLWEEISIAMGKLGYNRSSKRCKEKWENINKYYKKVKESNKKRPEDSKTCPYFNQLEAIYKERAINNHHVATSFNPGYEMKPENPILPIMARPEQQWPVPNQQQHRDSLMHDNDSENHEDDDDEDDDDEDEGGGYEIIANNKQPSSLSNTVE